MIKSDLYSCCTSVFIGINYENDSDIEIIENFCRIYRKLTILFIRKVGGKSNKKEYKLPFKSKTGTEFFSDVELGESETILAMIEHCQENATEYIFFLHSKGVTCPGLGGKIKQYKKIANSLNLNLADINLNELADAITHELILRYIVNWRLAVECSKQRDYHYLIWNIFVASTKFISSFKWSKWFSEETTNRYTNHKINSLVDRHAFAGFPIKLDSQIRKRNIDAIWTFYNFPIYLNLAPQQSMSAIHHYWKDIFGKFQRNT
jgi:hypothetical protein